MTSQIKKEVSFHTSRMETPLWTIKDILTAIDLMAPNMNADADYVGAGSALSRWAQSQWQMVEDHRCSVFDLATPSTVEAETAEGVEMTREAISLDTIQGDVTNLGHLLDELVSKINDLDFVKPKRQPRPRTRSHRSAGMDCPRYRRLRQRQFQRRTRDRPEGDGI